MKAVLLLAAALCAGALAAPAAAQQGTLEKIRATASISIGHRDASIPFSYYDERQWPIGYALDLCYRIVEAARKALALHKIDLRYQLVTSENRIPLMANGTIDLECGSTTNNLERQAQVAFTLTHFVGATRFASKKSAGIGRLEDLKGKTVVSTAGTTSLELITRLNALRKLGATIVSASGHPEAFLMLETDRAAAFVMDDILLHGLVATSAAPGGYAFSREALSVEPYGIMLRKDDRAFKALADAALRELYASGEIHALYEKWFQRPIPPRGVNLGLPMSASLRNALARPTDSGDPNDYQ